MNRIALDLPTALAHRARTQVLTVTGPDGLPLADTEVTVEQTRHAFGNIAFDFVALANEETDNTGSLFGGADPALAAGLADGFFDLFSFATLPFYWGSFEPVEGRPLTERMRRAAQWVRAHGAEVKGHPLAWHTVAPSWLLGRDPAEVERVLRARITREVTDFRGTVDMFDAINEVVIMPELTAEDNAITPLARRLGRVGMVRLAFETAREANPDVFLLLNDFNMSQRYERLIEDCLEVGIRIDALGLQSHMHQGYWGEDRTLEVLERFSRFDLPLHLTESTLVSGHLMPPEVVDLNDYQVPEWPSTPEGEARQAEEMVRHYTTLLSYPAVEAITCWGYTDNGSWLGAPVGLVRADGSPKPSFAALRDLVKGQWWVAPTTARTDAGGRLEVSALPGEYRLGGAVCGRERRVAFAVGREDGAGTVSLG
ncbi:MULTISPECIES: endo-1,4-beta-xylanase [unclassified Actinomyces]|uniref:endo-1,4-beta-xylanase n=1 Tax=unclassified Actinomyces TaxID=2609248 RepID=UPI002017BAE6|nr:MULTISPECIES: endo-1,4-beta-xylanase [unclassified Actinomyces]MCL3777114.1 endo-1,4-beta-xylanase [Actinomyces sp. AC-20-1]MCL3788970.1 endo-1,4-beta-xylanase [Actinomyces sp. 187325]MCL3791300.1 endo-1,4-beta-xylanase [Actinomyces sp. 186855]MCL3794131.1 endo-1,4-beta-xylanase [Actinomyces sp. 217892]